MSSDAGHRHSRGAERPLPVAGLQRCRWGSRVATAAPALLPLLLLLLLGGGTRAQSQEENCYGCGGGTQNQNIRVEVSPTVVRVYRQ
jgi:hypothetical protein